MAVGYINVAVMRIESDFRHPEELRSTRIQRRSIDRSVRGIEHTFLSDLKQHFLAVMRILLKDAVFGSVQPDVAVVVHGATVQILWQDLGLTPGIDHFAVAIELEYRRRGLSRIQFIAGQAFQVSIHAADITNALDDENVILSVDAN